MIAELRNRLNRKRWKSLQKHLVSEVKSKVRLPLERGISEKKAEFKLKPKKRRSPVKAMFKSQIYQDCVLKINQKLEAILIRNKVENQLSHNLT